MSPRSGTTGLIWLAIVMIAVSIATSAMGLFMDSWRVDDEDERDSDEASGSWGLTSLSYDCSVIDDDDEEEWCKVMMIFMAEGVEDAQDKYDEADDIPSKGSMDASEMCDNMEELAILFDDDMDDETKDDCEDTASAGETGSTILWIGFGVASISLILCMISAISRDSISRIVGGVTGLSGGLLMGLSVLVWSQMLPNGIGGEDNDWDAGLNMYLTIVGGVLAFVAGIIALLAGRKGDQSFAAPMHSMQQQFQEQQFQQQQYYQQPQQQQYQQPEPYQQW